MERTCAGVTPRPEHLGLVTEQDLSQGPFTYFHITPLDLLPAVLAQGIVEGDGRHWKGKRQHAIYLTDAAGVSTWARALRRTSGIPARTPFAVLGIDHTQIPLDSLNRRRFIREAHLREGYQMAIGTVPVSKWTTPAEAFTHIPTTALVVLGTVN